MRMNQGVEWGLHVCLALSWAAPGVSVTADQLAEYFDLPKPYLHKQIRSLARGGLVASATGPRGGYALARPVETITLMDVVTAIQGPDPAFLCTEIRHRGVSGRLSDERSSDARCLIEQGMLRAEMAWRRELAAQTLGQIRDQLDDVSPALARHSRRWFGSP
jgi:Rrf2 family protein